MDNQPIQPTPPTPSPTNSSKTLLLILGAIVLMAISAIGGYYLGANKQPSQFPTQISQIQPLSPTISFELNSRIVQNGELNIFQNERYGIEFTYPSNWLLDDKQVLAANNPRQKENLIQVNVENGVDQNQIEKEECPSRYVSLVFQAGIVLKKDQQDFTKFVESDLANGLGGRSSWGPISSSTVGNYQALSVESTAKTDCTKRYYIKQDDNHFNTISTLIGPAVSANDKQKSDSILNSLKLLPRKY